MSRIVDEPYFTYSAYNALTSGIQVKCPKCHGAGMVTADDDNAYFRCLSCGHQETRDRTIYRYDVHNQCKNCGRYYRVDIEDGEKQHFSVLHVACPYCGTTMSGEVHKTAEAFSYTAEIQDGREPYFGLELWFLTSFQGQTGLGTQPGAPCLSDRLSQRRPAGKAAGKSEKDSGRSSPHLHENRKESGSGS